CKVVEVELHGLGVGDRQDQGVGGARLGMHRSENVAPLVPGTTWSGRTLADGCPDPTVGWLETEARLVLEAPPHPLIRLCLTQFRQCGERFFGTQLGPQH
ncbi:MAG: hypothetical protein AVDCRST_MAG93-456, partial [uncultured Chloroflexia bacterium]